jgi:hypothetical protein
MDDPRRNYAPLDFDEGGDHANVQNLPPHFRQVCGIRVALYRGNRDSRCRVRHSVTSMVQTRPELVGGGYR